MNTSIYIAVWQVENQLIMLSQFKDYVIFMTYDCLVDRVNMRIIRGEIQERVAFLRLGDDWHYTIPSRGPGSGHAPPDIENKS